MKTECTLLPDSFASRFCVIMGIAVVMYVLSFGPLCWYYDPPRTGSSYYTCPADGWYSRLYWPLGYTWFYLMPKPVHEAYAWYLDFGAPNSMVWVPLRPVNGQTGPTWYGHVPQNRTDIRVKIRVFGRGSGS